MSTMELSEQDYSQFQRVAESFRKNPKTVPWNKRIRIEAYLNQAEDGDCKVKKPVWYYFIARWKWNAWKKLEGMSLSEAVKKFLDAMEHAHDKPTSNGNKKVPESFMQSHYIEP